VGLLAPKIILNFKKKLPLCFHHVILYDILSFIVKMLDQVKIESSNILLNLYIPQSIKMVVVGKGNNFVLDIIT
jgi:hypothetical protein